MQILSKESFTKIQYVIQGQNYANIYARLVLELPESDSSLFAKILLRGDGAEWVADDDRTYLPFASASPEEKELIAICLEDKKQAVLKKLHSLTYSSDLLTIPTTDQIFFSCDDFGNVSVKLTQWGFKLPKDKDNIDVISALIAKPRTLVQSQVNVLVRYSDGLPAGNEPFKLQLFGSTVPFRTNQEGRFNLGKLINGKPFAITDNRGNEQSFTVNPAIELYEVEFPVYTTYDITVNNQEGTPCANFNLSVDGKPMTTDDEGKLYFDDVLLTPKLTVEAAHEETSHKETYTLARDPEQNHFKFQYSEKFFSSLDVQVRYEDGEGLPLFRVKVGMDEHETDEYGHLHLEGIEAGTTVRVADAAECNHYVDVELQRGENLAEIVLERPVEKQIRVHLEDKKGNPIQNQVVKLNCKSGDYEGSTDVDGNLFFPASHFEDGEKVKVTCPVIGKRMKLKMLKNNK